MDERDDSLGELYRRSSREEPPARLDLAVLDMARRSVRRRAWSPFGGHRLATGSVAAVALLSVVLVTVLRDRQDVTALPHTLQEEDGVPAATVTRPEESLEAGRIRLALPPAGKRLDDAPAVAGKVTDGARPAPEPGPAGGAPAEPVRSAGPPLPRFDFYKTLPETMLDAPPPVPAQAPALHPPARQALPAPDAAAAQAPPVTAERSAPVADAVPAAPPTAEQAAPAGTAAGAAETGAAVPVAGFHLQVGAFRAVDAAERFRGRLVALGLPASVEAIEVENRETWYRVRIGPYRDMAAVDTARAGLKAEGIDSMLVKTTP